MGRHVYRVLCCIGLCLGMELAGSPALAKAGLNQETTLLVVPARPRMLQLAMDLADMRPAIVLSYRVQARGTPPLLFVWTNGGWQYVSIDDFRERRFVTECPSKVIMVGDDKTLPAMLEEEAAWGADVTRLKTLRISDLINGMDPVFHFTKREWKWMAGRYDLNLYDINEPRRKYNPYDIPRSKLPLAQTEFQQTQGDAPPAVLIETSPGAEAVQPAPAIAPKVKEPSLK